MKVFERSSYLFRLQRMVHEGRTMVVITLTDVVTGAEIIARALSVAAAMRLLVAQLDATVSESVLTAAQRAPTLRSTPRMRRVRRPVRIRSRVRSGQRLIASIAPWWSGYL